MRVVPRDSSGCPQPFVKTRPTRIAPDLSPSHPMNALPADFSAAALLAWLTRTARRHLDRRRREFRRVLQRCDQRRAVPVRCERRARDPRGSRCRSAPTTSGTASCRRRTACPASSTGCVRTGRTIRRTACATTATSCCSIRMRARWPASSSGIRRCSVTRRRAMRPDPADSAPYNYKARVIDGAFDWGDDIGRRRCRGATRVIYELHVKGFTKLHPLRARARARHVPRARAPRSHRASEAARRDRGGAAAGAGVRARAVPGRARPRELLGLQLARLVRAGAAVRDRRSRSPNSRRWSRRCTPPASK